MYDQLSQDTEESMAAAMAAPQLERVRVVEASDADALRALDYTCQYYLHISAQRFLELWDGGKISRADIESTHGLSNAVDMLSLLRP